MHSENQTTASQEWRNFGVLAAVLLGAVLVVALSRPLIFGRVVPAVLGDGLNKPATIEEVPVELPQSEPEATAVPAVPAEGEETQIFIPAAEAGGGAPSTPPTEEDGTALPTAVNTITHIVQPGETITQIANQYGITVDDITAANNLTNPNQVQVGQQLLIPQP
ncbi:MAG: hypothetical protein Kow0080_13000 [Candidatus Promineifilaceae bacterium]